MNIRNHPNAKVLSISKPTQADHGLVKPVEDGEIRILITGGAAIGKTTIQQALLGVLASALPNTEVIAVNDEAWEAEYANQIYDSDERIKRLSQVLKKVTLYTCQTNKAGKVKGVK